MTVHFERCKGGEGAAQKGECDLSSTGPLILGHKLQRVRVGIGLRGGQRMGWQLVLYLGLQEYREGTSKGTFLEGRKGSSFPVGAKKLQEEGEDVDDV